MEEPTLGILDFLAASAGEQGGTQEPQSRPSGWAGHGGPLLTRQREAASAARLKFSLLPN